MKRPVNVYRPLFFVHEIGLDERHVIFLCSSTIHTGEIRKLNAVVGYGGVGCVLTEACGMWGMNEDKVG